MLATGVESLMLNSQILRAPSPPGKGKSLGGDGSNLPWVVHGLKKKKGTDFQRWLEHVKTALQDIVDIETIERPDDKHRYLLVKYNSGLSVPSWLLSDGTLRLLALTIPAYLEEFTGIYLIEEPENGIHPRAIETVIQSLSSIYTGQVLVATHSPVALAILQPDQVLCFAKDYEGATDVVFGSKHPALRHWKRGTPDLGTIFASGVLS
jgi:predicted ATPase